jgi:hypothetical protein
LLSTFLIPNLPSMTTRLQPETSIRELPKETTGAPHWSGGACNEYLAAAMRAFETSFPRQATVAELSNQMLQGAALCEGLVERTNRQQRL